MIRLVPLMFFLACAPEPATCRSGFELESDGLCYEIVVEEVEDTDPEPVVEPTLEDLLATVPDCEPEDVGDRLDLDGRCADGACAGDSGEEVFATLGPPDSCDGYGGYIVSCDWDSGLSVTFMDDDGDGEADPDEEAFGVTVSLPWDGASAEGLGLGASMSCFVDALGEPDLVTFEQVDGELNVTSLEYGDFYIDDWVVNKTDDYGPDGRADRLSMYAF